MSACNDQLNLRDSVCKGATGDDVQDGERLMSNASDASGMSAYGQEGVCSFRGFQVGIMKRRGRDLGLNSAV